MGARQRSVALPARRRPRRSFAAFGLAAAAALFATGASAQNVTYGEVKLGILAHDAHFLGGKEHGADFNPEVIMPSPVDNAWAEGVPPWLRWMVQPRPTLGAEFNTAGDTNQFYFGATWSWLLARNLLRAEDGIVFGIFFGPGFNDGEISSPTQRRKSLGSNVLFRESFELGYQVTPVFQISAFIDHVSNGGLARQNQSINDVGMRFGVRF